MNNIARFFGAAFVGRADCKITNNFVKTPHSRQILVLQIFGRCLPGVCRRLLVEPVVLIALALAMGEYLLTRGLEIWNLERKFLILGMVFRAPLTRRHQLTNIIKLN
ncbi:MAG: hypothetical protein PUC94_03690 [Bacteroidales bacterium]|nr:hypothetical protein [Bacteroidales bacterium]